MISKPFINRNIFTHRSVCPLLAAVFARPAPEVRRLPRALHVDAEGDNDSDDDSMVIMILGFTNL